MTGRQIDVARAARTRWGWGGRWVPVLLLPAVVMAPLLGLPLVADHRFNVFAYGGRLATAPWAVVSDPITSVPNYLEHGNFRPLGRMVEQGLDGLTLALSRFSDLPVPVSLRVVALISAVALCIAAVVWVETITRKDPILAASPSAVGLLTSLAVPGLLVATANSATVLFTAQYLCSAALVLLVASSAARRTWCTTAKVGPSVLLGAVLVGAAMATFNELTYLAVPLALVTVSARGLFTLEVPFRAWCRSAAVRVVLALTIGFTATLIPVRLLIAQRCGGGGCYAASDLNLGGDVLASLGHRLASALPMTAWSANGTTPGQWRPDESPLILVGHTLILLVVVWLCWDLRERSLPSAQGIAALAAAGALCLLGASLAMASSTAVQDQVASGLWPVGRGWRDLGLAATGTGAMVVAMCCAVLAALRGWGTIAIVRCLPVLALGATVMTTFAANSAYADQLPPTAEALVLEQISEALLHPEATTADQRCQLLADFVDLHPGRDYWHYRLSDAVESASEGLHDQPFCPSNHQ